MIDEKKLANAAMSEEELDNVAGGLTSLNQMHMNFKEFSESADQSDLLIQVVLEIWNLSIAVL